VAFALDQRGYDCPANFQRGQDRAYGVPTIAEHKIDFNVRARSMRTYEIRIIDREIPRAISIEGGVRPCLAIMKMCRPINRKWTRERPMVSFPERILTDSVFNPAWMNRSAQFGDMRSINSSVQAHKTRAFGLSARCVFLSTIRTDRR
jgi:hypothetical protein